MTNHCEPEAQRQPLIAKCPTCRGSAHRALSDVYTDDDVMSATVRLADAQICTQTPRINIH